MSNWKPVETMSKYLITALLYDYLQNHQLLLVQQSKHLSILTDVLYKKEPSLCIILLFLAMGKCLFFHVSHWCGGSSRATAGACQLLGFEKWVWLIPSQSKTGRFHCKEIRDCLKGVCFGSVSPGTRERNPCFCGNERNCSRSYLETVLGKCNIVISAE